MTNGSWAARSCAWTATGMLWACAGSPLSSRTEDEARALVPVPICVQHLPRRATPGQIVSLEAREYWSLLLPGFDARAATVELMAPDCSGRSTLGGGASALEKRRVNPEEMVVGSGSDGFKVVWLPLASGEAVKTGLLALLRQRQEVLEVYALGIHEGSTDGSRLALERMGRALVVTVLEEHCRGAEQTRRCDSSCTLYLLRNGRLSAGAVFPVDHSVEARTAGATTSAEYRFSASADYRTDGVALSEKLSVLEAGRGEVRSVDLERMLRLEGDRLVPSTESLWTQTARQLGLPETLDPRVDVAQPDRRER
jgi:hypothetical protein